MIKSLDLLFSASTALQGIAQLTLASPLPAEPVQTMVSSNSLPAALMSFAPLQHLQGRWVRFTRAWRARHLPSSGFGYPLDGLLPGDPCRSSFIPAALLGFRPSKRSPLGRRCGVSAALTHVSLGLTDSLGGFAHRPSCTGLDFWALLRPGVPCRQPGCLAPPDAGCSLGLLAFLGVLAGRLPAR